MRSHRLAFTTVAVLAAVFAAGCGSGRDSASFLPDATSATPAGPAEAAIPQVVVAGPKQAVLDERDAANASAAASREAAAKAERRRNAARRALRHERAKDRRAHRRAAAREAKLRAALKAAEKRQAAAAQTATPDPTPKPAADAPITASDTGSDLIAERNKRSDAEARAAVVRFHELLDRRDPASCDMLTPKLLTDFYGADDPVARCQAAAAAISSSVSVVIAESRTYGKASTIAVVTRIGDQEFPQTMRLVLVDGSWLLAAVESRPAA